MKIDEKRLDELEANEIAARDKGQSCQPLRIEEVLELIRLAKLGIWAEQYGLPALKSLICGDPSLTKGALRALPKEKE